MIKLIDIFNEIKVNNPNRVELQQLSSVPNIFRNIKFNIRFRLGLNNELIGYSENTKNFLKSKNIPYQEIEGEWGPEFIIKDPQKYFKLVK